VKMPKPSDEDIARFRALVPDDPRVELKPMFGQLAAFINGNMFMGLFGPDVGVKLDTADREKLLAIEGAGPFGPAERPMGGYVTLPARWHSTTAEAERWTTSALAYVATLPAKAPKAPKAAKRPTAVT
jgi:TfoX/Sxy family transcriptional regulator of competence genes